MNGLTKRLLVYGWATKLASVKQTKKISAARERARQHDEREEEATKHRAEKRDGHIGRFKSFLQRGVNTLHEFSCTRNAVCEHVTYTVVTVHAICEGLM